MSAIRHLLVTSYAQAIGNIRCELHRSNFDFYYYPHWQASTGSFPLSPHFALNEEKFAWGATYGFVENLLPEGNARMAVMKYSRLNADNLFAMAHLFGAEPAGAASFFFHSGAAALPSFQAPFLREIDEEEISERIQARHRCVPFAQWDGVWYQSLAGVQDKLQVIWRDERLFLAGGSLTSTHILKPEPQGERTPYLVANEHFCMSLAAAVGLDVPRVQIHRVPEAVLLIDRFDRLYASGVDVLQPGRVGRTHIIDACQALDMPSWRKYECLGGHDNRSPERRYGVSFEKVFGLAPHFEDAAAAKMTIVRWAFFNLMIGNSDAHGKNISFHQSANGIMPAPFYDLVSVRVYGDNMLQEMAMAFGDQFMGDQVGEADLLSFAEVADIAAEELMHELVQIANAITKMAPTLIDDASYTAPERELLGRIAAYASKQAHRLLLIGSER
ncbi:HipA domain-containing protein [Herbaspirillum sp.]|uniref:HipA domain-containing protein n=1 Tax=Herbaspirillum sp. TaxID=1890675 RepID=UPI000C09D25D|nr:HipA domain-containing protein [Herbaspirillum sp.]MAF02088.1 phosphatidylinositol kinase [Herbaspirillum sp.]|tara:strand:+ start:11194 stop:12525 length:1332 start_codon:yes stop_codon:yes gene_type:complete